MQSPETTSHEFYWHREDKDASMQINIWAKHEYRHLRNNQEMPNLFRPPGDADQR